MADNSPLRERILKEAGALFLARGFQSVTLLEVVSQARTSKSSIYKYFRSKEHLVATLVDQLHGIIQRQLEAIVRDAELGFEQKLDQTTHLFIQLSQLIGTQFEADLRQQLPDLHRHYEDLARERIDRYLRPLFRQGRREEVLRSDVAIDLLLTLYLTFIELATRPHADHGLQFDSQSLRTHLNTLFLEGALES